MSDLFADLWKSSAPSSTSTKGRQTLGATLGTTSPSPSFGSSNSTTVKPSSQYDAFTMLASSSRPTSRPITPLMRNQQPTQPQQSQQQQRPSKAPGSGGDAFSSLLGSTFSSGSSSTNLSIAQRQALKERKEKEIGSAVGSGEVIWSGLDRIASPIVVTGDVGTATASTNSRARGELVNLDLGWGGEVDASSSKKEMEDDHDDWGLSEFSSAPLASTRPQLGSSDASEGIDALDEFISSLPSQPKIRIQNQTQTQNRNNVVNGPESDFDFGDREYSVQPDEEGGDEEDNILGTLGDPPRPRNFISEPLQASSRSRAATPPPHILGKIVEMGFSLEQAKTALQSTENGVDVEAALEMLIAAQDNENEREKEIRKKRPSPPPEHPSAEYRNRDRMQYSQQRTRNNNANAASGSSPVPGLTLQGLSNISASINKENLENLQLQADKLLAQASGIGMSVLKGAGAFWREKVGTSVSGSPSGSGGRTTGKSIGGVGGENGKPKWMRDDLDIGDAEERETNEKRGEGFRDDDDFDDIPQRKFVESSEGGEGSATGRGRGLRRDHDTGNKSGAGSGSSVKTADLLFGSESSSSEAVNGSKNKTGEEMMFYTSPARRRGGDRNDISKASTATASSSTMPTPTRTRNPYQNSTIRNTTQAQSQSQLKARPKPKKTQTYTSLPIKQSTYALLKSHHSSAKEMVARGEYVGAEEEFGKAVSSLLSSSTSSSFSALSFIEPSHENVEDAEGGKGNGHVVLIDLLLQRADVRVRNGNIGGAEKDLRGVLNGLEGLLGVLDGDRSVLLERNDGKVVVDVPIIDDGSNANLNDKADKEKYTLDARNVIYTTHRMRAEILEMREKWDDAVAEWGVVVAKCSWIVGKEREEAERGLSRCRRMIGGAGANAGVGASKEEVKVKKKPVVKKQSPSILQELSSTPFSSPAAIAAAKAREEAEEEKQHALKTQVDTLVSSWLSGKEGNIRALLVSLDMVLWEGVGWKKISMAEVIADGQVKRVYLKAVARVHPDKLNVTNTTLEQRMIANSVFAALNEAWNAFKQ